MFGRILRWLTWDDESRKEKRAEPQEIKKILKQLYTDNNRNFFLLELSIKMHEIKFEKIPVKEVNLLLKEYALDKYKSIGELCERFNISVPTLYRIAKAASSINRKE